MHSMHKGAGELHLESGVPSLNVAGGVDGATGYVPEELCDHVCASKVPTSKLCRSYMGKVHTTERYNQCMLWLPELTDFWRPLLFEVSHKELFFCPCLVEGVHSGLGNI